MSVNDFKESTRFWFGYPEVHAHARSLFDGIQQVTPGGAVIVAVGRGGWIPARLAAASFEEQKLPVSCFSVNAAYVELGSQSEHVVITQGLDRFACDSIATAITKRNSSLWVVDGPYLTGTSVAAVKEYLPTVLDAAENDLPQIHVGVLEWVRFLRCPEAPWRQAASAAPDAYGYVVDTDAKPYIEYPWEHSSFDSFPSSG